MQEPLQLYEHRTKWTGTKNPNKNLPACYLIVHVSSESVYVGSTNDLSRRCSENLGDLRHGTHKNKPLQKLYDQDPNVVILFEPCANTLQARFFEQAIVNKLKGSDKLCNIAVEDVTKSTKGRPIPEHQRLTLIERNSGRKATEETRQNMSEAQKTFFQTDAGQRRIEEIRQSFSKKVIYNGIEYPSISEASRQSGIPHSTITKRIRKQGGYL